MPTPNHTTFRTIIPTPTPTHTYIRTIIPLTYTKPHGSLIYPYLWENGDKKNGEMILYI